mmetsp:Transcript_20130/g.63031  ORF Transcript_20130/g.63031 Transcript_20130/m.63031 type:complete len:354 (+) Transcript_20130:813-1874(+)
MSVTSCCARTTYSLRDIWLGFRPEMSAPAFFFPMDSRTTPDCTLMVSKMGGCPCCSLEKPSVNSTSPSSTLDFLLFLAGLCVLLSFFPAAAAALAAPSCGFAAFLVVLPDSVRSCRTSFLMLYGKVSVTFGSLSTLISSTQMILPSVSKVCAFRAISSCNAMTVLRSSSFCFSASLAFRSLSLFLASSWNFWSRNLSSSSSSTVSSCMGAALGSDFSALVALADLFLASVARFCSRCFSARLLALLDEDEPDPESSPRTNLRTGRCMRAQLSTSPGSGSSSSSHSSSPAMSSPLSWATKHMVSCETTASVTAPAAKAKAFRSRYFCHRIVPPSMRTASMAAAAASSAPLSWRL